MARGTHTPAVHLSQAKGVRPVETVIGCHGPQWCFFLLLFYFLLFLICSKPRFPLWPFTQAVLLGAGLAVWFLGRQRQGL